MFTTLSPSRSFYLHLIFNNCCTFNHLILYIPQLSEDQCVNDDEVCKGANNPLQYRVITLPNELRVLLISNNKTSTAGAAMDVHSGFFQDTLPGMAHFCEHMLFLGTEKYPEEGSYSQFLTSNGGTWNAFTRSEYTIYFFSVNSEKLTEAADIFAQFFIAPLFTESAVNREINAVNSEFELTKGVPDWYFISIMNDVADPKSEYSRYDQSFSIDLLYILICVISLHIYSSG